MRNHHLVMELHKALQLLDVLLRDGIEVLEVGIPHDDARSSAFLLATFGDALEVPALGEKHVDVVGALLLVAHAVRVEEIAQHVDFPATVSAEREDVFDVPYDVIGVHSHVVVARDVGIVQMTAADIAVVICSTGDLSPLPTIPLPPNVLILTVARNAASSRPSAVMSVWPPSCHLVAVTGSRPTA